MFYPCNFIFVLDLPFITNFVCFFPPAKWTPVFYLICCDPYWDNFGVYLPDRKCFALKYLLTRRPAVNVHSDSGLTPLIHAINEGNQAAVKLLVILFKILSSPYSLLVSEGGNMYFHVQQCTFFPVPVCNYVFSLQSGKFFFLLYSLHFCRFFFPIFFA